MSYSNIDESLERIVSEIENIISRQEGADENITSLESLTQSLLDDIVRIPRRKLTTISDLLLRLRGTSWSLQIQEARHKQLEIELNAAVANIRRLQASADSYGKYEFVEAFMEEWRKFMYALIGIDDLEEEVKIRCQDLITLVKRLKK